MDISLPRIATYNELIQRRTVDENLALNMRLH